MHRDESGGISDDEPPFPDFDDDDQEPDALEGRTLGNCRLEGRIAEGGMGAVYRGVQLSTGRPVAIKVMHKNPLTRDRRPLERFFREARIAAEIDHPNVVRVFEAGIENELAYMVMELVPGRNLKEIVRGEGPLHPARALEIMIDAARGLGAAHALGVVHRDVKPANLLIDANGVTKLADFGLVRGAGDATLTRTGLIVGTPDHMSPESCRGEPVGPSADLYALGGTFYFAVIGQPPFGAAHDDVPSLLLKHAYHPPPDPRALRDDIPGPVADLIQSLLAKRPEGRPAHAAEAVARLDQLRAVARAAEVRPPRAGGSGPIVRVGAPEDGDEAVPETLSGHMPRFVGRDAGADAGGDGPRLDARGAPSPAPADDGRARIALAGRFASPVDEDAVTASLRRTTPAAPAPPASPAGFADADLDADRTAAPRGAAARPRASAAAGSIPGALGARELLVRGKLHMGAHRYRAAADDFRQAARLEPGSAPAWLGLARALALLPSEQRDALDALERAIGRGVRDAALLRRAVEGTSLEEDARVERLLQGLVTRA